MPVEEIDAVKIREFQDVVWNYYSANGRNELPWRQPTKNGQIDPYHVLVSELMLQQTQVNRVIPKFNAFLVRFPTVEALAQSELSAVLTAWSGLGYNRRAKFLHQAAAIIVTNCNGLIPGTQKELVALPGIGPNTAAAIISYSFNEPIAFIETNIRTVFLHHFFIDQDVVADSALIPYIEASLDVSDPRGWYWALMDYGTFLKSTIGNISKKSKHHTVQSVFEGSRRQIRGRVVKYLLKQPRTKFELEQLIVDERLPTVLNDLVREGLIASANSTYKLGK